MYVTLTTKYFANIQEHFENLNLDNSFENYIMSLKYWLRILLFELQPKSQN